ncbi:glutathione peroxidase [Bradyrhizobium liaoningense]
MTAIYDFQANSLAGEEVLMRRFEGQVLLIVNTASKCGFTPQYRGLEDLYRDLSPRGFSVLGFPCNQFGAQEPGQASEIQEFCSTNYDVTFPLFEKIDVNGPKAHQSWPRLFGQRPAGFKWIPAGLC